MVSDIQKLHKVIVSLEEQSLKVTEFNGVLSAVNSAKEDISLAKSAFEELAEEQKQLVTESYTRFDAYRDKLAALEKKLSALDSKILTTEQFEQGTSNTEKAITTQITQGNSKLEELIASQEKKLSALDSKILTTEQFEQGTSNTEKAITTQITQGNSKLEELIASQEKSIQSLRTFVVLGILALASWILYLASIGIYTT